MDQRPQEITPLNVNRLFDFLDGLQAAGFDVDTRHYIALSDLLLSLAAQGEKLRVDKLKTIIAPLICASPTEQETFYDRFDQWYGELLPELDKTITQESTPSTGQRRAMVPFFDLRHLLPRIAPVLIVALLVTIVYYALVNIDILASPIPYTNSILKISIYSLGVVLIGWLMWFAWNRYRENQFITRETAREEPLHTFIPVAAHISDVLPVIQFKPVVSALRRRTQVPSNDVDVEKTIEQALNQGTTWLEFIYRQRQVMPEYVVLIERKSRLDQQARFVQEVLQRLAADGVWLHSYEFSGDPRLCFPLDKKDTPLHLEDLQHRFPNARILIFSGASEFINPLTGQLQNWVEPLSFWKERAVFTPDQVQKSLREEFLARDFAVLPMSLSGLAALIRAFEVDSANFVRSGGPSLPPQLTDRPMRWTTRDAPPQSEFLELVSNLKKFLGEAGFFWLCAAAIYPELRWELTLHLGNELRDKQGNPVITPDILVRLIRLPWFRYGYMPDWVRLVLVENLTREQENQTRDVLENLLASAYSGEGFDLAFSRTRNESIRKRTRRFLEALIRNEPADSQLKDYIFIKFVSSNRLRRLAVQVPRIWNNIKTFNPILVLGLGVVEYVRKENERFRKILSRPLFPIRQRARNEREQIDSLQGKASGKIFLSYSRKDVKFARKLAGDLETVGYDVWWDLSDLQGGDDWVRMIPAAIESSTYMIVILTPNSVESEWVRKEYTQALSQRKRIIPIMLSPCNVPFALNTINFVNFMSGNYADNFKTLLSPLGYIAKPSEDQSSVSFEDQLRTLVEEENIDFEQAESGTESKDLQRKFFDRQLIPRVPRDSYSNEMAWLLAKMSQLAYERFEEGDQSLKLMQTKLKSGGFRLNATFNSTYTDTQAFLTSNGRFAVLAFRGVESANTQDVLRSARASRVPSIEGRVHRGFYEAFQSIEKDILQNLGKVKGTPIFITGHSLGAALALLTTQSLGRVPELRDQISACYTFGSPRVGDVQFDREIKTPVYRVVNTADIVTVTPLLALGYVHVGDVRYLGRRDGEIFRGIPFFRRLFFFLAASFRLFGPLVGDHSIFEYISKLEVIAQKEIGPRSESKPPR